MDRLAFKCSVTPRSGQGKGKCIACGGVVSVAKYHRDGGYESFLFYKEISSVCIGGKIEFSGRFLHNFNIDFDPVGVGCRA